MVYKVAKVSQNKCNKNYFLNEKTQSNSFVLGFFGFRILLMPLLHAKTSMQLSTIIRSFFRYLYIMRMAFFYTSRGDFYKLGFVQGFDIDRTAIAHACF